MLGKGFYLLNDFTKRETFKKGKLKTNFTQKFKTTKYQIKKHPKPFKKLIHKKMTRTVDKNID